MKYIDMHCDTITSLYNIKGELKSNNLHIDISKLKAGQCLLQNFAVFTRISKYDSNYTKACIDYLYSEIEKNKEDISLIFNYDDILKNEKENKISAMLTLEDGSVIDSNIDNLDFYYSKGVRMIALTWNYITDIGYPNISYNGEKKVTPFNIDTENGLTTFGIDMIKRMEELGIIIDVSHLSDKGFYDVLTNTKRPFVASHSNARTISPVGRNLTDDMLKKLSDRGGVTGLNLCAAFLDSKNEKYAYLEDMVSHIKHIVNVGGIDVMGLGMDLDGIDNELEIKDSSGVQVLFNRLEKEFSIDELERIFYKNVLRVYKEVIG